MELDIIKDLAKEKTDKVLNYLLFPSKKTTDLSQLRDFLFENLSSSKNALLGKTRKQEVVFDRYVFWAVIRFYSVTFAEIGRPFKKDHSTILHGIKSVQEETKLFYKYSEILVKYILEFEI